MTAPPLDATMAPAAEAGAGAWADSGGCLPAVMRDTARHLTRWQRLVGTLGLLPAVVRHLPALRRRPVRDVLLHQIAFSGYDCFRLAGALAVLTGLLIVIETTSLIGQNVSLAVSLLSWTVLRELGPLLVSIVVVARSCSAVASELATMTVGGEIASLERMGISPLAYLVMPRMVAIIVAVMALTIYFDVIALVTGLAYVQIAHDVSLGSELDIFLQVTGPGAVQMSLLKAFVFSLPMALISCQRGLSVADSPTEIPRAASQAVVACLANVFLWDVIITAGAP